MGLSGKDALVSFVASIAATLVGGWEVSGVIRVERGVLWVCWLARMSVPILIPKALT